MELDQLCDRHSLLRRIGCEGCLSTPAPCRHDHEYANADRQGDPGGGDRQCRDAAVGRMGSGQVAGLRTGRRIATRATGVTAGHHGRTIPSVGIERIVAAHTTQTRVIGAARYLWSQACFSSSSAAAVSSDATSANCPFALFRHIRKVVPGDAARFRVLYRLCLVPLAEYSFVVARGRI